LGAASRHGEGLGWGRGGKGEGKGIEGKWREREGLQVTVEPGPLRAYATVQKCFGTL